jgi:hypothetical protein
LQRLSKWYYKPKIKKSLTISKCITPAKIIFDVIVYAAKYTGVHISGRCPAFLLRCLNLQTSSCFISLLFFALASLYLANAIINTYDGLLHENPATLPGSVAMRTLKLQVHATGKTREQNLI